jgi:hypothetical protein
VQRGGERIYPSNSQMAKVEQKWPCRKFARKILPSTAQTSMDL